MDNIRKILSKNIKKSRVSLGVTQEKFAELIKVQPRTIPNIETGRNIPKPETLERICKVCNIALFELFLDDEQKQKREVKYNKIAEILNNVDDDTFGLIYRIIEAIYKK